MCISAVRLTEQKVEKIQQPNRQLTKEERLRNMKRVVGFFAVVVLALTLGIAAYGKASPKRNLGNKAQTSAPQASSSQDKMKMKKKRRRHGRHKTHRSGQQNLKNRPKTK